MAKDDVVLQKKEIGINEFAELVNERLIIGSDPEHMKSLRRAILKSWYPRGYTSADKSHSLYVSRNEFDVILQRGVFRLESISDGVCYSVPSKHFSAAREAIAQKVPEWGVTLKRRIMYEIVGTIAILLAIIYAIFFK